MSSLEERKQDYEKLAEVLTKLAKAGETLIMSNGKKHLPASVSGYSFLVERNDETGVWEVHEWD